MRRFLLALTAFAFLGWSQPAQPQAQPPIVINNVQPHEGFWTGLLKLAIPTIAGAALASGITLYGLKADENKANRQHELEKLKRQHSFELKRDVLMRVTLAQVQTLTALIRWEYSKRLLESLQVNGEEVYGELKHAEDQAAATFAEYKLRGDELSQATTSSRLAISDELWQSAKHIVESIRELHSQAINDTSSGMITPKRVDDEITQFTEAARMELGVLDMDAQRQLDDAKRSLATSQT
jgi:hypothetical protein